MLFEERFDAVERGDERSREIGIWSAADDDEEASAVPDDRVFLVRRVADATVVRERYPTAPTDFRQPVFVGRVVTEMIAVTFNGETGIGQDLREFEGQDRGP